MGAAANEIRDNETFESLLSLYLELMDEHSAKLATRDAEVEKLTARLEEALAAMLTVPESSKTPAVKRMLNPKRYRALKTEGKCWHGGGMDKRKFDSAKRYAAMGHALTLDTQPNMWIVSDTAKPGEGLTFSLLIDKLNSQCVELASALATIEHQAGMGLTIAAVEAEKTLMVEAKRAADNDCTRALTQVVAVEAENAELREALKELIEAVDACRATETSFGEGPKTDEARAWVREKIDNAEHRARRSN